ncbi:hypothetical protein EON67_07225 [archaeon]|nr:MAG: hypothetical protein EON67_07225 [archaeon]
MQSAVDLGAASGGACSSDVKMREAATAAEARAQNFARTGNGASACVMHRVAKHCGVGRLMRRARPTPRG